MVKSWLSNNFSLRRSGWKHLRWRMRTAWMSIMLLIGMMLPGYILPLAVIGFASFMALKEMITLLPSPFSHRQTYFLALLAIPLQLLWVGLGWYETLLFFIPLYTFFILVPASLTGRGVGFFKMASGVSWSLMLTLYPLSHLAYIRFLPDGWWLTFFLLLLVIVSDATRFVGRRMLQKPNSALIASALITGIAAIILSLWMTPFSRPAAFFLGAGVSITGSLGRAIIRAILYDLGQQLGSELGLSSPAGQGGVLARIASLLMTAPIFLYVVISIVS